MVKARCLVEKKQVEIKNPEYKLNKICRPVAFGQCPSCGRTVYKLLAANEVPADLKAELERCKAKRAKSGKGGAGRKSHRRSHHKSRH